MNIIGNGSLSKSNGIDRLLSFTSDGDGYVYDPTYTPFWRRQWLGLTPGEKVETQPFLDMLFVVNGLIDAPRTYNGNTTDLSSWSQIVNVTDMPKAKFIKLQNNRLYLFGIKIPIGGEFASRVWFADLPKNGAIVWDLETGTDLVTASSSNIVTSAGALFLLRGIKSGDKFVIASGASIGEYTVDTVDSNTQITLQETLTATGSGISFWTGGNFFDVERDNSDIGMGLGNNFNRLLCFKRHSVHKFQKTTDFATDNLLPIKGAPGTTSNRSIVDIPGFTYWWSDTGLWRTDGVAGQLMSIAMQEVVDGMDESNLEDVVGWFENDRIVKMFIGDINNTVTGLVIDKAVFCYDTIGNTYWVQSLADNVTCAIEWVNGAARKRNFLFTDAGEVFKTEQGNSYDGDSIYMQVETYPYFAISPEYSVNYNRIKLFGENLLSLEVVGWKRFYYDKGFKDKEPQSVKKKNKSENEIEITVDEDKNKAAGFALLWIEDTAELRPIVTRITAYWSGGELR